MARRKNRGRHVHGILLLDKPSGQSSNHALQRVKRLYGANKAGHTGSLDPLATGMLPVCFGEATKLSGYLLDADKGYETTLKLGVTTNSADSDGEVEQVRAIPESLNRQQFDQICSTFIGPLQQIPPMVSAIKIDGQRLYKLARAGKKIDRPPRAVTIHSLEVVSFCGDTASLVVRASKGTYIRSLVADIGEAIGCGAHVTALRRIYVSPFEQNSMLTIDALEQLPAQTLEGRDKQAMLLDGLSQRDDADQSAAEAVNSDIWQTLDAMLLPVDAGLHHLPRVTLAAAQVALFVNGGVVDCACASALPADAGFACRVYDESGRLIGLGECHQSGEQVAPRRVLQWS